MGADKGTSMATVGNEIGGGGDGMQCADHPYGNNPGGICAFCLQEKLGKLVSSSSTSTPSFSIPNPSSSSSSPSFRSDYGTFGPTTTTRTATVGGALTKALFLSAAAITEKKKHGGGDAGGGIRNAITTHSSSSSSTTATSFAAATKDVVVLKRSKSVAPRPIYGIVPDAITSNSIDSPRKRRFWSFLNKRSSDPKYQQKQQEEEEVVVKSDDVSHQSKADQEVGESPSSIGRKVSRSRSVGCGSRGFSGDLLERISTGFGDCTLRRVESHRESSKKVVVLHDSDEQRIIKERVKCGGIFGMISSSSGYWLSAAAAAAKDDEDSDWEIVNGSNTSRASTASIVRGAGGGKSRYWSWAFASPLRAFRPAISSTSSSSYKSYKAKNGVTSINNGKSINGSDGKVCVNPSLLAVGS